MFLEDQIGWPPMCWCQVGRLNIGVLRRLFDVLT